MEINITLVIQAIHFYMAYVILDRLILRSAVSTIQLEQRRYTALVTTINDQLQLLKDKELHRHTLWQQFRASLKERVPRLCQEHPTLTIAPMNGSTPLSSEQKENYKKEVIDSLIRRLGNVS